MIKLENAAIMNIENALRGMRNPLQSWEKSDSYYNDDGAYIIGENDLALARRLVKAGSDDRKFLRQIFVSVDVTAPQYWVAELDTYKVSTTRNSCSLQHKGASRPFTIKDFTVSDEIYEILDPSRQKKQHSIIYHECDPEDYKLYTSGDREYKVYRNGKVVACEYSREDVDGRVRASKEREVTPSQSSDGYWYLNLGGRIHHERWFLHRLIAKVWLSDSYFEGAEVNHIDSNKGNNSVDNLEWVTHAKNNIHKFQTGNGGRTLRTDYLAWKNASKLSLADRHAIVQDYDMGTTKQTILAEKYGISQAQVSAVIRNDFSENDLLFCMALQWEHILELLNSLREKYLETNDYRYFRSMRALIPMGYNYTFTWTANYENLINIYYARRNHKLDEWHVFCDWIATLPYFKEMCVE